jgi:hypothetical protein
VSLWSPSPTGWPAVGRPSEARGVTPAPNASVIQPDQGWYEITTVSMHQLNFWMEFERLIFGHITPGRLYAVLLQVP